jgi:DNA polymerase-3 subunit epsilon
MKRKTFWFDTETTGLDKDKAAIVTLAYIIEYDGQAQAHGVLPMAPHAGAEISDAALKVNGFKREEIQTFQTPNEAYLKLLRILGRHVNKYDKLDKLVMAGYNVGFDEGFLRALFTRLGDQYYGSWFYSTCFDVRSKVAEYLCHNQLILPNFKLESVCSAFNIHFGAHDAMEDIRATRDLYYALRSREAPGVLA